MEIANMGHIAEVELLPLRPTEMGMEVTSEQ